MNGILSNTFAFPVLHATSTNSSKQARWRLNQQINQSINQQRKEGNNKGNKPWMSSIGFGIIENGNVSSIKVAFGDGSRKDSRPQSWLIDFGRITIERLICKVNYSVVKVCLRTFKHDLFKYWRIWHSRTIEIHQRLQFFIACRLS